MRINPVFGDHGPIFAKTIFAKAMIVAPVFRHKGSPHGLKEKKIDVLVDR
jgi:hypothetical protein